MAGEAQRPNVVVFGGCGFIGRNLVSYLLENGLVSSVRVVDKVPPQVAWLSSIHREVFEDPRVVFKSANLINQGACDAAFEGGTFKYAFNCACETKPGQTEPVYREGIYKVSMNCATAAANHRVDRFVELSSGAMYSSEKTGHKEDDKVDPWTQVAKFKFQVEEGLRNIPGLRFTILRPAIVYGVGDKTGIVPRLVIGGIYKHLNESMKLLWDKNMVMNTVHVEDLCRAMWHVCQREDTLGHVYNVADDGHTTQGLLSEIISELFNINHDYYGNTLSSICKTDMIGVVEEVNDKHSGPWAELCARDGVENTPLSPYIHQELLYNKHLNLDTSKLRNTNFTLTRPQLNKERLQEVSAFPKEKMIFQSECYFFSSGHHTMLWIRYNEIFLIHNLSYQ
ncbi:hypothetical protein AAG570_010227 [Ranatra chinensis]|uniref:NAD-dependent epimerase/dehydratase domain-containing protein n=1 Tax=Ranatra chinensis TaxID=642074 RepID=A0ABD0YLY7_9HEMI